MRNFTHMKVGPVLGAVLLLTAVGCNDPSETLGPSSFLRAEVLKESDATILIHEGGAAFGSGGSVSSPGLRALIVSSSAEVLDTQIHIEGLGYQIPHHELLPVGVHELEPLDRVHGDGSTGFTFHFLYDGAEYVSESGLLTIERAADHVEVGVIEGSFEAVAVRWREVSERVAMPESFPPDAERIRIKGSFVATPAPKVPVGTG